jgi:agmatinase
MRVNRSDEPSYSGGLTFRKVPLALEAAHLEGADVVIIGAPMDDMVTNRPGARFGPREIRGAYEGGGDPQGWHMDLGVDPFAELKVVDRGDASVQPGDAERSHRAIRTAVAEAVGAGAIPLILGGDHSIAFPDIVPVAEALPHGSLAVVQFDTHTDTAIQNWGVEWAHGTPFRYLVDRGVIPGNRLIQVGLRGYWPGPEEFAWARGEGVRWHRMEDVTERGIDAVIDTVLDQIADAEHLFLSVDIDVLDPAYAPGTGTPEPGGMTTRELLRALRRLILAKGLAGMDLVEVSPPYDHAQVTALAAHGIVMEALSALAVQRRGGDIRPETSDP